MTDNKPQPTESNTTMSNDIWDNPELATPTGLYAKWETPGDSIAGDVTSVTVGEDMNGRPCPVIGVRTDDGEDRIISASQAMLKSLLVEKRPLTGDRIKVTFTKVEKRDGGKTLKVFEVSVTKDGAKGTALATEEPF